MLTYLNGVGAVRRRKSGASTSRATRRAGAGKFKGALKKLSKLPPGRAVKTARQMIKKASPLNKIRIKKALKQTRVREVMEEAGEPLMLEPAQTSPDFIQEQQAEAEAEGEAEVTEQEFPESSGSADDEQGGPNMPDDAIEEMAGIGVYYPVEISGKKGREKRQLKKEKKQAKTDKTKAKSELKRAKGQAKLEKARAGGGKFKESFDKALDTAGKFLDKKKGGGEEEAPAPSFFEKNKTMLIIGGVAVLGIGAFMMMKKK